MSGQREVGEEPAELGTVTSSGVRVRNLGDTRVFVGGPDVSAGDGYPIEPGTSEDFSAPARRDSPVVPAPASDMAPSVLYAVTEKGSGAGKVALIGLH